MAISTTMDIYGVKQAIATLKEIDPDYRKEMLKQVKKAGDPVLVAARSLRSEEHTSELQSLTD
jgi:hypothetical protein